MIPPEPPSGRLDGVRHLFPVRAYFEDTDLSGVVYHANYLRWFERARSDMLRLAGIDQRAAHEAGEGAFAVTAMDLRWLAPARLDDAVLVVSRVVEVGGATCAIEQAALRGAVRLCTAQVRVAFVAPNGRPRRLRPDWIAIFRALADPARQPQ